MIVWSEVSPCAFEMVLVGSSQFIEQRVIDRLSGYSLSRQHRIDPDHYGRTGNTIRSQSLSIVSAVFIQSLCRLDRAVVK